MSDKDTPAGSGANPNPFAAFEGDRTLIKPSAGRAPRPGEAPPPAQGLGWASRKSITWVLKSLLRAGTCLPPATVQSSTWPPGLQLLP